MPPCLPSSRRRCPSTRKACRRIVTLKRCTSTRIRPSILRQYRQSSTIHSPSAKEVPKRSLNPNKSLSIRRQPTCRQGRRAASRHFRRFRPTSLPNQCLKGRFRLSTQARLRVQLSFYLSARTYGEGNYLSTIPRGRVMLVQGRKRGQRANCVCFPRRAGVRRPTVRLLVGGYRPYREGGCAGGPSPVSDEPYL